MTNLSQQEINEMVKREEIKRLVDELSINNGMTIDPIRLAEFLHKELEELRGFPLKRLLELEMKMANLENSKEANVTYTEFNGKKIKK